MNRFAFLYVLSFSLLPEKSNAWPRSLLKNYKLTLSGTKMTSNDPGWEGCVSFNFQIILDVPVI